MTKHQGQGSHPAVFKPDKQHHLPDIIGTGFVYIYTVISLKRWADTLYMQLADMQSYKTAQQHLLTVHNIKHMTLKTRSTKSVICLIKHIHKQAQQGIGYLVLTPPR